MSTKHGKVIFEVIGGDPAQNKALEEAMARQVARLLEPKKLWRCRCECGEVLGSGYKRRISLARVVPHCEGVGMHWEQQNPTTKGEA